MVVLRQADVTPGTPCSSSPLPIGTIVHNTSQAAAAARSLVGGPTGSSAATRAGARASQFGETRRVRAECMATVGAVSNPDHMNESTGKAGRTRWRGTRPTVRSIAMNPVDHPNGGRTKGGKHWATPWGKPTKGAKTRKNKATDRFIVRPRHASK